MPLLLFSVLLLQIVSCVRSKDVGNTLDNHEDQFSGPSADALNTKVKKRAAVEQGGSLKLAETTQCGNELMALCSGVDLANNIHVLECVQNAQARPRLPCLHVVCLLCAVMQRIGSAPQICRYACALFRVAVP